MDEEISWQELIRRAMEKEASDMHWTVGQRPHMRCEGVLAPVDGRPLTEPFMAGFCAVIMDEEQRKRLAREKGRAEEFGLYEKVEQLAPRVIAGERKMYKGVCANVDFYSGFAYQMLGIPEELFTPIFAIARIAGWSAHRIEELINGGRIIRPAYKGVKTREEYVPLSERKGAEGSPDPGEG